MMQLNEGVAFQRPEFTIILPWDKPTRPHAVRESYIFYLCNTIHSLCSGSNFYFEIQLLVVGFFVLPSLSHYPICRFLSMLNVFSLPLKRWLDPLIAQNRMVRNAISVLLPVCSSSAAQTQNLSCIRALRSS